MRANVVIPRHELIATALQLGISRPESLTQQQLLESIQRASESGGASTVSPEANANGWLRVARHLVARVVEQGLNMPEAARLIGGARPHPRQKAPLPTVTLAQIYLGQGHEQRARVTLQAVLEREPENAKARMLLDGLQRQPPGEEQGEEQSEQQASKPRLQASESSAPTEAALGNRNVLVVLRDGARTHLYWELAAATAERLSEAKVCALVRVFCPDPNGAQVRESTVEIDAQLGTYQFDCPLQHVVRAVLGVRQDEATNGSSSDPPGLEPRCVASSRRLTADGKLELEFSPREGQCDAAVAQRALVKIA